MNCNHFDCRNRNINKSLILKLSKSRVLLLEHWKWMSRDIAVLWCIQENCQKNWTQFFIGLLPICFWRRVGLTWISTPFSVSHHCECMWWKAFLMKSFFISPSFNASDTKKYASSLMNTKKFVLTVLYQYISFVYQLQFNRMNRIERIRIWIKWKMHSWIGKQRPNK